jgi:toxin ParE1/3/4
VKAFLRPRADQDIDEQALYIAGQAGVAVAWRFLDSIQATLTLLRVHPSLGKKTNFQNVWLKDTRFIAVKGFDHHIVFYKLSPRGLEIIRLVHGARAMDNLF